MKLKPLYSNIVIKPDEAPEKTKSGIILHTGDDKRMEIATVIAIGPGRVTTKGLVIKPCVKPGDRVIFRDIAMKKNDKWFNPNETENLDDNVYFIDESDILAIVEDEDKPGNEQGEVEEPDVSQYEDSN